MRMRSDDEYVIRLPSHVHIAYVLSSRSRAMSQFSNSDACEYELAIAIKVSISFCELSHKLFS